MYKEKFDGQQHISILEGAWAEGKGGKHRCAVTHRAKELFVALIILFQALLLDSVDNLGHSEATRAGSLEHRKHRRLVCALLQSLFLLLHQQAKVLDLASEICFTIGAFVPNDPPPAASFGLSLGTL